VAVESFPQITEIGAAILAGDDARAAEIARQALVEGRPPLRLLDDGCIPAIREAGRLFAEGEYFLPELVCAAQAMKTVLAILEPELRGTGCARRRVRVVIGTVAGDIHDIGKTLVGTLLAAHGYEVHDEGVDVPVERFVARAREVGAELLCASALLTTTMAGQRELVAAVRAAGLPTRVLVGGAPVQQSWADEIGADGYAETAVGAVELANRLVRR